MARAHLDHLGRADSLTEIPGAHTSEEDRAAYFNRLGRPEEADGYNLRYPGDWPKDAPPDPEWVKEWRQVAHDRYLTRSQSEAIFEFLNRRAMKAINGAREAHASNQAKLESTLATKWGDEAEGRTKRVSATLERIGVPEFAEFLKSTGTQSAPAVRMLLDKVGDMIGQDIVMSSDGGSQQAAEAVASGDQGVRNGLGEYSNTTFDDES
jgi:hypothetical protein